MLFLFAVSMAIFPCYGQQGMKVKFDSVHLIEGAGSTVALLEVVPKGDGKTFGFRASNTEGKVVMEGSIKLTVVSDSVQWGLFFHPIFARWGLKDGAYREWYDDGTLRWECAYRKGETKGSQRRWYPNGKLMSEEDENGFIRIFDTEGKPMIEMKKAEGRVTSVKKLK